MRKTIVNNFSDEEFINIVNSSTTFNDIYNKMGYSEPPNSYSRGKIKSRIVSVALKYGINEEFFK